MLFATVLRFGEIGRESLWFDEVVSMRLARQPDPIALLRVLPEMDATAAPLHPLILQGWVAIFGPSDGSGRALSAIFGVVTVVLTAWVGRRLLGGEAGLWAGWLVAISPLLVQYSREIRMYAWLTLNATIAWSLLAALRDGGGRWVRAAYVVSLAAMGYAHPLGLLMVAALALASGLERRRLGLSRTGWAVLHGVGFLLIAPWLPRYLDHEPSIASERWLGLRYLLGLPIGFVGGNFVVLALCVGLIGWGLIRRGGRAADRFAWTMLGCWLLVPPALLYGYSLVSHPIFGQARYTLFVGPAYLVLLGGGLARLPKVAALLVVIGLAALSASLLNTSVYAPGIKADWRAGAVVVRAADPEGATVVVYSEDPRWSREVEVARYYLGPGYEVRTAAKAGSPSAPAWLAVGLREGRPVARLPERPGRSVDLPGLRLLRLNPDD